MIPTTWMGRLRLGALTSSGLSLPGSMAQEGLRVEQDVTRAPKGESVLGSRPPRAPAPAHT